MPQVCQIDIHIEQSLQLLTSNFQYNLPQSSQLLVQIRQPWLRSVATVCRVATSFLHISSINKEIHISMATTLCMCTCINYQHIWTLNARYLTQTLFIANSFDFRTKCKQFPVTSQIDDLHLSGQKNIGFNSE